MTIYSLGSTPLGRICRCFDQQNAVLKITDSGRTPVCVDITPVCVDILPIATTNVEIIWRHQAVKEEEMRKEVLGAAIQYHVQVRNGLLAFLQKKEMLKKNDK